MAKRKAGADQTVADLAAQINAVYPGAVRYGSDDDLVVKRWPTDVLPLDDVLDGGIPRGRFIEVYGSYSTLKSYFAYKSIAAVQRRGGRAILIDTEHSWDPEWGKALGVDVDILPVVNPQTAEDGIGAVEMAIRNRYDLFVFDSIAAAVPQQVRDAKPGDDNAPGSLARVMSKGLARLMAANRHTAGIWINQTREKIGITFGSPKTTSGGLAMGFYASYRLSFVRTGKVTEDAETWDGTKYVKTRQVNAHQIQVVLEKSKLSRPHKDAWFLYDLRRGEVDETNYLVAKAIEAGLVERSSAGHYKIPDVLDTPIHGKDKFYAYVTENQEIIEWLTDSLMPQPPLASPGA